MIRGPLIWLSLFLGLSLSAQTYPATYHLLDELRGKALDWIQQDEDGFIWLVGQSQLFRYDGWTLQDYDNPLPEHTISHFASGQDGLWLGYEESVVARQEGRHWKVVIDSFCAAPISGIEVVDNGLIIATYGEGVWLYREENLTQLIPDLAIYQMETTPTNDIWLATDQGVYQLQPSGKIKQQWTERHGLPDRIVQHMVAADSGVWVATYDSGLAYLPGHGDTVTHTLTGTQWPYGQVEDLVRQPDGTLWIATWEQGIVSYTPGQTNAFPVAMRPKVQQSDIVRLLVGEQGATWALVHEVGLLYLRSDVGLYQDDFFEPEGEVLALHADQTDNLWISTMNGLYAHNIATRTWSIHTPAGLLDTDLIIAIQEDELGNLWLGTFGEGLLYYDVSRQTVLRITEADGLINDNILDIEFDAGFLWLATLGGVSKARIPKDWPQEALTFTNYDQQNGLGANYIYDVHVDRQGNTWFATDGEGLTRLTAGVFTNFNATDGLESEVIYTVTEDPQGHIWFSTLHSGIYRYDGSAFLHLSKEQGLHGVDIVALACDPNGHLVVVHEEGVDVVDTRTLNIIHLEDDIGLMDVNANLNVITTQANGDIWIGLQEGMVHYHGGQKGKAFQPSTRLEYLEVYLEPYDILQDAVFSYRENHLSFGYVGMWFANPQQVSYQYQLEGYDLGWITTKDREAIYPSLAPGDYTFKVRSSIDGRFDNAAVAAYSFTIARPFWQTWWFSLLLLGAVLGLLYVVITNREKRLQTLERMERERIDFQFQTLRSQVNPHFLFNSFNTLLNVIDIDKDRAITYVEKLSDFFRSILAYRDVEVITLAEELRVVQDYYFLQQQRYGSNFSLHMDVPQPEQYAVPPLILQLLVENALKHNIVSRQKPLEVEIFLEDHHLVVRNNLQHKVESEAGTRVGLTNIKKRYQMLTERPISIEETATHFTVRLPIIPFQL